MSLRKLLFAVWISLLAAVCFSFFFGGSGVIAMRALEKERERLSANMRELRTLNGELEGEMEGLRTDPDEIAVYARELGYAPSQRDRFIRITGLPSASRKAVPAGNLLKAVRPRAVSDADIRVFAALFGILSLAIMLYPRKSRRGRR